MTSIILISHGKLATSMESSIELIMEIRENVYCMELGKDESLKDFKERLEKLVRRVTGQTEEIIIVSDFPLSTPFNAAAMLMEKYNIYHLTGMNMPMLLVLLHKENLELDPEYLCKMAVKKARDQTLFLNDLLKGGEKL